MSKDKDEAKTTEADVPSSQQGIPPEAWAEGAALIDAENEKAAALVAEREKAAKAEAEVTAKESKEKS